MARTPLAGAVQDAVAAVAAGEERRTTRTRFVKEAGVAALGMTALNPVVIEHPLSSLTDDEISQRAAQALPQIKSVWLTGQAREA